MKNLIKKGSFLSHFLVLAGGTALAQAIPALTSPVLTRLYAPEDFGLFAVFMAAIAIFTPAVCGKYEVALVLPKKNVHAQHLLGTALYSTFIISAILSVLLLVTGDRLLDLLHAQALGGWAFMIPVALLVTGILNAFNYFSNRQKAYHLISKAKILQAIAVTSLTIGLGFAGAGFTGMLFGYIVGLFVSSIFLIFKNKSNLHKRVLQPGKPKKLLAYRYRDYPLFNASTGLLNGLSLSLPVFFLASYYPVAIVGYYALVQRVANAPVSFISGSIAQINLKKVVDLTNSNVSVLTYLIKLSLILISAVSIPVIVIVVWGPEIFGILFGEKWIEAGKIATILMPAVAVRFVASTISSTLGATNNNRISASWRIVALIITFAVFVWAAPRYEVIFFFKVMVINDIFLYVLYYALIVYAGVHPRRV